MIATHENRQPGRSYPGYSLMELTVAMASSSVLLVGIASSLFVASRAFEPGSRASMRSSAAEVQADMLNDLNQATSFSTRTADTVTFTIPDATGDALEETVTYSWNSASNQLELTYNGSRAVLLEDVTKFLFSYDSRSITAEDVKLEPFDINEWGNRWATPSTGITFEEFTEATLSYNGQTLSISLPSGTSEGDLLIAALAIDGEETATLPGWTPVLMDNLPELTFAVWYKIASASEPGSQQFSWGTNEKAYGWIMRFTGHDPLVPIHATDGRAGSSALNPPSGDVTTLVDGALVLRLGAFDDDNITVDVPGLSGHTAITMDWSNDGKGTVSGGAGYTVLPTAGNSGTSTFSLTSSEQYITLTIAIAPELISP